MRHSLAISSIEDLTYENIAEDELPLFLDIFEYCMKKTAVSGARIALFDLDDFAIMRDRRITSGTLKITRRTVLGQIQWFGRFETGPKLAEIIGTLEEG